MANEEAIDQYRQYVAKNPADRNGARRSFYDKFGVDPEGEAKPAAMSTAPDIEAEQRAQVQKAVAANESIREAKATMTGLVPVAAGMAAAPLTGGMSLIPAMGTSALVAAGAEGYRQVGSQLAGLEDPYTTEKALLGMGKEAVLGAGMEGAARGASSLLRKAFRVNVPKIDPADAAVFSAATKAKAPLTAAEVTGGGFKRLIQRWTEKSTFGEKIATERREAISDAMSKYISEAMDKINQPTSPLGTAETARGLSRGVRKAWDKTAGVLFDEARRAAPPGKVIDLTSVTEKANALLTKGGNLREEMPRVLSELTPEEGVLKKFLDDAITVEESPLVMASGKPYPPTRRVSALTVEQATELRKLMNEKYHLYNTSGDRQAAKTMKEMGESMDEALSAQVGGPASPYMKALRDAKQFYKEGYDLWDTSIMADLLNKDPSATLSRLNVRDPQALRTLQKVFTKWGDVPAGMNVVRRQAMQDIFSDAMWNAGPEMGVSPKKLATALKGLEPESQKMIFGSSKEGVEVFRRMHEFVDIATRVEKVRPGLGDRMMSNIAMLGWGLAHQSPAMLGAAGANIGGPKLLAAMMNQPVASLHLSRAMQAYEKALVDPKLWPVVTSEAIRAAEGVRRFLDSQGLRKAGEASLREQEKGQAQTVSAH